MSELRSAKFATTVIGEWIRAPERPVAREAAQAGADARLDRLLFGAAIGDLRDV